MAQTARPVQDTHIGNYTDQAGGVASIFQAIDEASADDADFVVSPAGPSNEPYVCKLEAAADPGSSSNHIVGYRFSKDAAGSSQVDLTVELRQGYLSEASKGTLIASWSHLNVSEVPETASNTLLAAEADAITDYADLYLRFVYNMA